MRRAAEGDRHPRVGEDGYLHDEANERLHEKGGGDLHDERNKYLGNQQDVDPRDEGDTRLRDEVDDLVAAWRAERSDLDVEPLQVLSRVSRLARHTDRVRRAAFAGHGLELWEFDVLAALRRQGPPYQLSPGALVHATLVTSGTMTNRIDRLEQAGLVRRGPDPQDKRGVLVTLTGPGRSRVDAALSDLLQAEQLLLSGLSAEDRHTLARLLRVLLAPLDHPRRSA